MTYVSCYYHAFQGAQQVGTITKKKTYFSLDLPKFALFKCFNRQLVDLPIEDDRFGNNQTFLVNDCL